MMPLTPLRWLLLLLVQQQQHATMVTGLDNGLALTPPMGWLSCALIYSPAQQHSLSHLLVSAVFCRAELIFRACPIE